MVEKTGKKEKRKQVGKPSDIELPIPVPEEEKLQELFRGKNIAIHEGKVIAQDESLRKLHEKFRALIPGGRGCYIRYIDEGASIYGSGL